MARWNAIIKKILFPKLWVILLGVPLAAAGLIFVFIGDFQAEWFSYPVYVFSAYMLSVVCVRIWQASKHTQQHIDAVMERAPVVQRYFTDVSFNMHVSLYRSLALNVIYAIAKFFFGVYYRSVWFGTLAIYYLLLAVTRFALVHYASRNTFGANMVSEWKRYRLCGMILLLMNLALTGVVIMVIQDNEGFYYAGVLIYIMAMYAFYSITVAIINVIKYRKYRSPVMSAAKVLHLAAAMVSMLALETAMLSQFGGSNSERFRYIMTGATGGGVCAVILGIAVYMICRSTMKIKMIKQEELS